MKPRLGQPGYVLRTLHPAHRHGHATTTEHRTLTRLDALYTTLPQRHTPPWLRTPRKTRPETIQPAASSDSLVPGESADG
jgi:hypothetical protein